MDEKNVMHIDARIKKRREIRKKNLQITEHMILEFNQICIDSLSPTSGLRYFSTHNS